MAFLYTLPFARMMYHVSALLKYHYMCVLEPCYCVSTEYQQHIVRGIVGYDADLSGPVSSSGC